MHITTIFLEHFFSTKGFFTKGFPWNCEHCFQKTFCYILYSTLKIFEKEKKKFFLAFIIFCKSNSPKSYVKNVLFWTYYIGEYLMCFQFSILICIKHLSLWPNKCLFISIHCSLSLYMLEQLVKTPELRQPQRYQLQSTLCSINT